MIKAIETIYNGYRFRSRLEARWAVFFDTLGIPYDYEKEGYELSTGDNRKIHYLPDFWMPEQECWIEIKGEYPDEGEHEKASLLAIGTGYDVYLFFGKIKIPGDCGYHDDSAHKFSSEGHWDNAHFWCECPVCHRFGIEFNGRAGRLPCHRVEINCDKHYNYSTDRLVEAYKTAMYSRFEHGEKPSIG